MVPDAVVPSSKYAVMPSSVFSNLTSFLSHYASQPSGYAKRTKKKKQTTEAYLNRQILHQQFPEALPLKPQPFTRRDLRIDFPSLHIQEQEIAVIHLPLFGVNLDFQKPLAEVFRKTHVKVLQCPVDRDAPSLAASLSMQIALEDGETNAMLHLDRVSPRTKNPHYKTHLFQCLSERETHDSGANDENVKRSRFSHETGSRKYHFVARISRRCSYMLVLYMCPTHVVHSVPVSGG